MNKRYLLSIGLLCLAVLVLTTFAPSASAGVVGTLSIGICGSGVVVVNSASVDWVPTCLVVGGGTSVTSVGDGNLIVPAGGPAFPGTSTINDLTLPPPSPGDAGFMTFVYAPAGIDLIFNLAPTGGLGPGLAAPDCSPSPAIGQSCSIAGSPFILTTTATGTSVVLPASGTIYDTGDHTTSYWSGQFSANVDESPATIEAGGGAISESFSGKFDITPVPEPVSVALIGGGLLALAGIKRRKRA
jgi:hypothetical protein